jgi:hypothetical protein
MATPALSPAITTRAIEAVGLQHARLRTALNTAELADGDAENYATHISAVNQCAGRDEQGPGEPKAIGTIVGISMSALTLSFATLSVNEHQPVHRDPGISLRIR